MQELIDMLRMMAGSCRALAAQHPVGRAQAIQAARNGSLPGIRAGIADGVMVRIVIERSNNDANSEPSTAEADAWNSLWHDPSHQGEA